MLCAINGAGIGGGNGGNADNITISGGTIEATGHQGAGIGGGSSGDGTNINITGGDITATNKASGAGIGGGAGGDGTNISITGGTVTATNDYGFGFMPYGFGSGIGGGDTGNGSNIYIGGDSQVTANAASGGAIGAGSQGTASNITISDNATVILTSANGNPIGSYKEAVEPDISKLTASGSITDTKTGEVITGTYVPPAPPAPTPTPTPTPTPAPAPAPAPTPAPAPQPEPEPVEEVKPVEPPVVKVVEEKQAVKVQGEEVQVTLNETTVQIDMTDIVVVDNKAPSVELVINVAPQALETTSEKVDTESPKTLVAALKELVKNVTVDHITEEKESSVSVSEYMLDVDDNGSITLKLSEKLMRQLGKGIHEFVITIGGMEIVFTIEIK